MSRKQERKTTEPDAAVLRRLVFSLFLSAATVLGLSTCVMDWTSPAECGDGVIDDGEQCDGTDLGGATCVSLGYYGGTLTCAADCRFDRSDCENWGYCGDDVINGPGDGTIEECDGTNLGGETCADFPFDGGNLACGSDCMYDTTGCYLCGDSVITPPDEECEGTDFGGQTCQSRGYNGGDLRCRPAGDIDGPCTIDDFACF